MKTICLFGIYDPDYSRNQILYKGFKENGWNIVSVRVDPQSHRGLRKYIELIKEHRKAKRDLKVLNIKPDVILVAFPGHTAVWLARLLWLGYPIYFDAFLSRYDSNSSDRKLYGPLSFYALIDWLLDWSSCALSRKVLLDTYEHISYFSRNFLVSRKKMIRVPIGADTDIFYPRSTMSHPSRFIVHFHGMFIPLQGLSYILEAAEFLKGENDIVFHIIGSGQQYKEISDSIEKRNISNVALLGKMPVQEIPRHIEMAGVCLGIFGDTKKTTRVIPNKVYECIAMKKAVITADTPAIREFFTDSKHMILCERGNGKSIAEAIIRLRNDPALAEELARNSYAIFSEKMRARTIVSDLIKSL